MQNFSSLAGLEVTEKFDLIYFFGWPGGWPGGWLEKVELRLFSTQVEAVVDLKLRLSLAKMLCLGKIIT